MIQSERRHEMIEGFWRLWTSEIIYILQHDPSKQEVSYIDVAGKIHFVPEEKFSSKEKIMAGDMVVGPAFDHYYAVPWARKIVGWNFVRGSGSNDFCCPKFENENGNSFKVEKK